MKRFFSLIYLLIPAVAFASTLTINRLPKIKATSPKIEIINSPLYEAFGNVYSDEPVHAPDFMGNFIGQANGLSGTASSLSIGGTAATATALASAPTQCNAGNFPLGIDAQGNAQNCTPASGSGTVTSITASAPLTGGTITSTGTIGCSTAGTSQDGCLAQGDFNTFNNKQNSLGLVAGTLTDGKLCSYTAAGTLLNCTSNPSGTGTVTSIVANSPLTGGTITTTGTLGCQAANGSQAGCLSSGDWSTFNGKQPPLGINPGTFTDTKICTYSAGGSLLNCNTDPFGSVTSIATASPLTGGPITVSGTVGCQAASGSQAGCLASSDFTTFNNKQPALSLLPGTYANGKMCTYTTSGTLLNCNGNIPPDCVGTACSLNSGTTLSGAVIPSGATLGTLTNGKACTYTSSGTVINCNTTVTAGTVTNFSFVNANGISGNITNPTTTPALSLIPFLSMAGVNWNDAFNLHQGINWYDVPLTTKSLQTFGSGVGKQQFFDGTFTHFVGLQGGTTTYDNYFTLPLADGTNGQVLKTDGSGHWSFTTLPAGSGTVNSGSPNQMAYYAASGTTVSPTVLLTTDGNGLSTSSWTDPIVDFSASGSNTTTTGTISIGTNSLAVASASGWSIGMGIAVANAGTGGTTELITYITNIVGTTFTLHDNAIATATTQTVNHDDTRALNAAAGSGRNPQLRNSAIYNITSALNLSQGVWINGAGQTGLDTIPGGAFTGSIIQQRSLTADTFNITSQNVEISNLEVIQAGTPTAGYFINQHATQGSSSIRYTRIHDIYVRHTFGGIEIIGGSYIGWYYNIRLQIYHPFSTGHGLLINNQAPDGDLYFVNDLLSDIKITQADTNLFQGIKVNNNDAFHQIDITDANGQVVNQRFVNCSIEAGSNVNSLISMVASTNGIYGTSFVGGEVGSDNGDGGFTISGSKVDQTIISNVAFSAMTGAGIADTTTGGGHNQYFGNTYNLSSPVGTNTFTGKSGFNVLNPVVPLEASIDGTNPNSAMYSASDGFILTNSGGTVNARFISANGTLTNGSGVVLGASRGTSASPSAVADGDAMGTIVAQGYDGSTRESAAFMQGFVDGTPSSGSYTPGSWTFTTNLNGSESFVTRMRANGHLHTKGTAPSVSSCGTSPSITSLSTDNAGSVQVGSVSATSCTVTFAHTWANAPNCIATDDTSIIAVKAVASTSTLTLSSTVLTGDKVSWICQGNE